MISQLLIKSNIKIQTSILAVKSKARTFRHCSKKFTRKYLIDFSSAARFISLSKQLFFSFSLFQSLAISKIESYRSILAVKSKARTFRHCSKNLKNLQENIWLILVQQRGLYHLESNYFSSFLLFQFLAISKINSHRRTLAVKSKARLFKR